MSPVTRAGVVFGFAAVGAVIGAQLLGLLAPIPCIGFISVIVLGLAAGYTAAKNSNANRDQRIARGATAGAIAGAIVLVLGAIAVTLISFLPAYQAQFSGLGAQLQQDPNFADSGLDPSMITSVISGGAGIIGGICGGLINFIFMLLMGLLGSLFWKGAPASATYVPAGGSAYTPPSGSYVPTQTNVPSATPSDTEGGARVYDADDPNRPR